MNMTDIENTDIESVKDDYLEFAKWEVKVIFNSALAGVKVNDMGKDDKVNLIKLKIKLNKIAIELQEYEKSVVESLKNSDYLEAESKATSESASDEDKKAFESIQNKLEKDANELCLDEYNKIVKIECNHITEDVFYLIADYLDIQMLGGYDYIYNKLVK